jgi:hypothetical protein
VRVASFTLSLWETWYLAVSTTTFTGGDHANILNLCRALLDHGGLRMEILQLRFMGQGTKPVCLDLPTFHSRRFHKN